MKRAYTIIAAIAGVGLGAGVIVWLGAGKIVHAVLKVGWGGFALLIAWQFVLFVILATAWWVICPEAKWRTVIWGRLVREGGANVLPFSEVGGLIFGARAVTLAGMPSPRAIASSFADVSAEFIGEIPFIVFGFAMLLARDPNSSTILPLSIGLGVVILGVGGMIWAEKHSARLFHAIGRRIARRSEKKMGEQADRVQEEFDRLFGNARRLGMAASIHLVAWIGGGISVWITYHLLGGRISVLSSIALEGLLSAALSVAFLVPGGIGIQEISYIGLGHLFGMPASMSLGLSLLRRARDIVIGVPALGSWQIAEARQLRRDKAKERPEQAVKLPG